MTVTVVVLHSFNGRRVQYVWTNITRIEYSKENEMFVFFDGVDLPRKVAGPGSVVASVVIETKKLP